VTTEKFKELLGQEADRMTADELSQLHDQMARLAVQVVTVVNNLELEHE
jgi:hypothetical protein